ncbi:MAG: hypothetical protein AAGF94_18115 [Pseudomonadota bacterium]
MTQQAEQSERAADPALLTFASRRVKPVDDKPMFYAETRNTFGQWVPCRLRKPPEVNKGRIVRANSVGPLVRPMGDGYCKEIPSGYAHLNLDQLHQVLSPDGRSTAGQKAVGGRA